MNQSNVQTFLTPEQFLQRTQFRTISVVENVPYTDGQTQRIEIPASGLGHFILLQVRGTVTVAGSVSGGTFKSYPAPVPYGLLKRIQFGNNNAFNMVDMSGWAMAKYARARYAFDPYSAQNQSRFSNVNLGALGCSGQITPGGNVTAQTYSVNFTIPIPLSYNNRGEKGLIILQSSATKYTLVLDWEQITGGITATGGTNGLFNALTGTGLSVTSNIQVSVLLEYAEFVPGADAILDMFVSRTSQVKAPLIQGQNEIILNQSLDFLTMMQVEIVNNGTVVDTNTTISQVNLQHNGNIFDVRTTGHLLNARNFYASNGAIPQDGTLTIDLGRRNGLPEQRDLYDAMDIGKVTDAKLQFTYSSAPTGVNQIESWFESIRYLAQTA
jgi:hypothetical protein